MDTLANDDCFSFRDDFFKEGANYRGGLLHLFLTSLHILWFVSFGLNIHVFFIHRLDLQLS